MATKKSLQRVYIANQVRPQSAKLRATPHLRETAIVQPRDSSFSSAHRKWQSFCESKGTPSPQQSIPRAVLACRAMHCMQAEISSLVGRPEDHHPNACWKGNLYLVFGTNDTLATRESDLQYLNTLDVSRMSVYREREVAQHLDGTCTWLLNNDVFKRWSTCPTSCIFWLTGEAGMGKTVLTSFLSYDMKRMCNPTDILCFFLQPKQSGISRATCYLGGLTLSNATATPRYHSSGQKTVHDIEGEDCRRNLDDVQPHD